MHIDIQTNKYINKYTKSYIFANVRICVLYFATFLQLYVGKLHTHIKIQADLYYCYYLLLLSTITMTYYYPYCYDGFMMMLVIIVVFVAIVTVASTVLHRLPNFCYH